MFRHSCYYYGTSVTWADMYSTSVLSDWCFGTPSSATTLLLCGQARSDQCFSILAITTVLLLRGQARIVLRYSLIGVSALLLVLRHFCYVGRHVLISASSLLLVLQHFCRGQARSDQCFGTLALCYGTLVLYCTFRYLLCCALLISYYWSRYSNSYMIRA